LSGTNVRQRAQPVDAGVRPEVDQHDFPAQSISRQRRRIEPPRCLAQCRQRSIHQRSSLDRIDMRDRGGVSRCDLHESSDGTREYCAEYDFVRSHAAAVLF
jgi:hypothetical protein